MKARHVIGVSLGALAYLGVFVGNAYLDQHREQAAQQAAPRQAEPRHVVTAPVASALSYARPRPHVITTAAPRPAVAPLTAPDLSAVGHYAEQRQRAADEELRRMRDEQDETMRRMHPVEPDPTPLYQPPSYAPPPRVTCRTEPDGLGGYRTVCEPW